MLVASSVEGEALVSGVASVPVRMRRVDEDGRTTRIRFFRKLGQMPSSCSSGAACCGGVDRYHAQFATTAHQTSLSTFRIDLSHLGQQFANFIDVRTGSLES